MATEAAVPERWPAAVRRAVERVCGAPRTVESLGGMSGSHVQRVRGESAVAIVKGGVRASEMEFYRVVAPLLREHGVVAPDLYWSGRAAGSRWLLLEDVPHPVPRERWGADPALLGSLARLHGARSLPRLRAKDAYRPSWPERLTRSALTALPAADAAALAATLEDLRLAAEPLFTPQCPLSGDANPNNWGLRDDGTLVLFDWERYCHGTPALDLAAALPGLGTAEEYDALARAYLAAGGTGEGGALGRAIGRAKVWTAVEFLAGVAEGVVADGPVAAWLRDAFPDWLRSFNRVD